MLSSKQMLIVILALFLIFCVMNNTSAHTLHIGGGHQGGGGIGNILAAGIVLSLLQQHG